MAIVPFIPLIVQAAIGSARAIHQNQQNVSNYDRYKKEYSNWWASQEKSRIQRAQIIQQMLNSDPRLRAAAGFLTPDFWSSVMKESAVPDVFGKRPTGGLWGAMTSGALGGLQINPEDVRTRFDALSKDISQNAQTPDIQAFLGSRYQDQWNASHPGYGAKGPPTNPFSGPGFDVNGDPTYTPLPAANRPDLTTPPATTSAATTPTVSSSSVSRVPGSPSGLPAAPPVLSGMGLHVDPLTGKVVNKFGATVEF